MKHKEKPYKDRKVFKRKQGGGRYYLSGDARYRSAMPSLADILSLTYGQSALPKANNDISFGDMIKARLPNFKVMAK